MNKALNRKVTYLILMAIALVPLYGLSAPAFLSENGERSAGGWLTQLRDEYGLSQANLGEIDPASESMKLATLGMRGVAANLLWGKSNEYKKKEEWDNYRATLNQIAKLQPNFISVWKFQAWNLSYNVSVEFDNYEHRYHWVKKGIEFLMTGIRYNRNEPRLLWDLGWFFGHKFGRSDEYVQFRDKYRKDEDFHDSLEDHINIEESRDYDQKPDNWLTAHQWFKQAQDVVDLKEVPIRGQNPLVFHSDAAKALIRYADAIENEGIFDEKAMNAWINAANEWMEYGERSIPTSYGYSIRLNNGELRNEDIKEAEKKLEELAPGVRERLEQEKRDRLTAEEKQLLARDRADLDAAEYEKALKIDEQLRVSTEDVINEITVPEDKRLARKVDKDRIKAMNYATTIRRYRDVVNFVYWKTRCEVEQQQRAIDARRYLWEANEKYENADLLGALTDYDESWKRWASIHNEYTVLAEDVTAEDLVDHIKRYRTLLSQLDRDFPPPKFPMLKLVANYPDEFGYTREEGAELMRQAEAELKSADAAESDQVDDATAVESSEQTEAAPEEATTPDEATATDEDSGVADSAESNLISLSPDTAESNSVDSTSTTDSTESTEAASDGTQEDAAASEQTDSLADSAAEGGLSLLESAQALYEQADLAGARAKFEAGFQSLELSDSMPEADVTKLIRQVRQYRILLGQLDASFPPDGFPLADFVKLHAEDFGYTAEEVAELFDR